MQGSFKNTGKYGSAVPWTPVTPLKATVNFCSRRNPNGVAGLAACSVNHYTTWSNDWSSSKGFLLYH